MPSPADPDLEKAIALHQAGDFTAAHAAYQRRLARAPMDIEAIHGLGLIALDLGQANEALPLFARCIAIDPEHPVYRTSYGLALLAQGDLAGAAGTFLDAANRRPVIAEPRLHLARALIQLRRWQEALAILDETAALFPGRTDVWLAKGTAERQRGLVEASEISLRKALALEAVNIDVMTALAGLLKDTDRLDEALGLYQEALARGPDRAACHVNFGNALAAAGRIAEAEGELREAMRIDPTMIAAGLGLGLLLTAHERPEEAIPLFNAVLASHPDHADALTNLGVALLATGDVVEAERQYRRALERTADNAEAHYNLAWVLLLTGRWTEAWPHYGWRWKLKHFSSRKRGFRDVLWDGAPFKGTLLVHAEQGLGDTIQFVRFLAVARTRCDRVVLECQRPLARLLAGVAGADQVIASGDPIPPFDRHVPLMSLAGVLGITVETIPAAMGYLSGRRDVPAHLRLPDRGRAKIGLVWAGSPENKIDLRRSVAAQVLLPLMKADADFVSLQLGARATEVSAFPAGRIVFDCNTRVGDFADTAAVIAQLDLVIGVDTAAVHLAGAMGKPVWLMLPFMPDFRWLLGREDTPWYASARLFRQESAGNWAGVLERLVTALTEWQPNRE